MNIYIFIYIYVHISEQEMKEEHLYNVGDIVAVKADRDITPDQRFWLGEVMNITRTHSTPDINEADPEPEPNAPRWYKLWWREAKKEYGKYRKAWHRMDNRK